MSGSVVPLPSDESKQAHSPFINWATFFAKDRREEDWIYPDLIARGRAHVIYATHKLGKSLLTLFICLELIRNKVGVIYLDYEQNEADVFERLEDMGCGPETDMELLHYALLPSLPPLDTLAGAKALLEWVDNVRPTNDELVIVFDTVSRAVAGEENSADTIRDFYRFTGLALKQRGITWIRLDHAGKSAERGQRGTSAKGDDVDIVWRLSRTDNGLTLIREAARIGWVPAKVALRQLADPLRFQQVEEDWPAGTKDAAEILDSLDVDPMFGERRAGRILRDAGHKRATEIVRAAQKYRRLKLAEVHQLELP